MPSKWQNYSKEQLQKLINESQTKKDFFLKMGYQRYSYKIWNKIIEKYPDLKYSHLGRKIDLTGKKFNKLKVIEEIKERRNGCIYWKCLCDCGNPEPVIVKGSNLTSGEVKSCGCLGGKFMDLSGQQIGRYKVIKRNENPQFNKSSSIYYWIQCNCGNPTLYSVRRDHIINQDFNGCQWCGSSSAGELKLKEIFENNNISYKTQITFPDLKGDKISLRFDFGIYNSQGQLVNLIEFNGIQHYQAIEYFGGENYLKRQQRYDLKKEDYCSINGIKLITIPYYDIKNISLDYLKERGMYV